MNCNVDMVLLPFKNYKSMVGRVLSSFPRGVDAGQGRGCGDFLCCAQQCASPVSIRLTQA